MKDIKDTQKYQKTFLTDIKKLSAATVKEIQELIGSELVYLMAVDVNGKPTTLTREDVSAENIEVSVENPIKTQAITSINAASFGTYVNSCHAWILINGKLAHHLSVS